MNGPEAARVMRGELQYRGIILGTIDDSKQSQLFPGTNISIAGIIQLQRRPHRENTVSLISLGGYPPAPFPTATAATTAREPIMTSPSLSCWRNISITSSPMARTKWFRSLLPKQNFWAHCSIMHTCKEVQTLDPYIPFWYLTRKVCVWFWLKIQITCIDE